MKDDKNLAFNRPFFLTLCIACFALYIVLVPAGYAQTPPRTDAEKEAETRQYLEVMNSVYNFALENYVDEIDPRVLYEGALQGMLDAIDDPYTVYMDSSQLRDLSDTTEGNFGGVGLSITKSVESTDEEPAFVEVASPIEDSPGWQAGIQAGDLILTIDGVYTPDITMDEVLGILRGEVGDPVDLTIRRGETKEFPITLVRALIEVPTVKYGMIIDQGRKTGYLRIIEFTPQTPERVQDALDSFEDENFDSLLIDLRNNPGGLIESVVEVADKFIESGVIVSTKSRLMFENSVYRASGKNTTMPGDIPIVVLINEGSASASEILAGALKDYHLAYLVGERTFGKGSVQQVRGLPHADGLKLTMARYYTPSNSNIDKIGIPPDMEVLFPEFTDEEQKAYAELMTSSVITDYVEKNTNMTEIEITAYAQTLGETYDLEQRLLRRIIRLESTRMLPVELYDIDFDLQLIEALELFDNPDFDSLVKSAKTLSELQALAVEKEEDTDSDSI